VAKTGYLTRIEMGEICIIHYKGYFVAAIVIGITEVEQTIEPLAVEQM
jgi:hypothetical protein